MAYWSQGVTVVLVALALAGVETTGEVEALRESPSEAQQTHYNKVDGFSLVAGGTKLEASSREECEGKCSTDAKCKSYSWREEDKVCIASTRHLQYDDEFTLYVKAEDSNTPNKFHKFQGMYEAPSGFSAVKGVSATECQERCEGEKDCAAFSFSMPDDGDAAKTRCFLTTQALDYSPGFDYYEKKSIDVSAKQPEPTPFAAGGKDDPVVNKLELKEKAKLKAAQQEEADANRSLEEWKKHLVEVKQQAQQQIADAKKDAQATVEKAEADKDKAIEEGDKEFEKQKNEEWGNKLKNLQLEFAAAEIKEKKEEKEKVAAARAAQQEKNSAAIKELDDKKSAQALEEGSEEAKLAARAASLHDQDQALLKEKQDLAKSAAGLKMEQKEYTDSLQESKESISKKETQDKEVAQKKKTANDIALKKQEEEEEAKLDKIRAQSAADAAKTREEAEKAADQEVAEAGVKNSKQNKRITAQSEDALKQALKKEAEDEQLVEAARERAQAAEATAMKAAADEQQTSALAGIKKAAASADAENVLAQSKIQLQKLSAEKDAETAQTLQKVKDDEDAKEQAFKSSARKVEEAAKADASEKAKKEKLKADENAKKYEAKKNDEDEKAAAELAEKKEHAAEASKKAYIRLEKEEKESREKLTSQEVSNKKAAKKIRDGAAQEALKVKAAAADQARITKKQADEAGAKAGEKQADLAKKASMLGSGTIKASVAAFVDSGETNSELNMEELNAAVARATKDFEQMRQVTHTAELDYQRAKDELAQAKELVGKADATFEAHSEHLAANPARRKLLQVDAVENAQKDAISKERTGKAEEKKKLSEKARDASEGVQKKELVVDSKKHALAKFQKAKNAAEQKMGKAERDQQAAASSAATAGTAWGKDMKFRNLLRIQNSPTRQQSSFIKFPTATIGAGETVTAAHLRLYQVSGAQSRVVVKVSACTWDRSTITYTNSLEYPDKSNIVQGHAVFPATDNVWADVPLSGPAIQAARASGADICLQVSGGPEMDPAIFESENTSRTPILAIQVSMEAEDAAPDVVLLDDADEY